MKYKTTIDTDEFKDFKFFEDGIGPYMVAKDANACADNSGWIPLYFKEVDGESESVLDKVRVEIRKKMRFNSFNEGYVLYDDIKEVLDKYKAESDNKQ